MGATSERRGSKPVMFYQLAFLPCASWGADSSLFPICSFSEHPPDQRHRSRPPGCSGSGVGSSKEHFKALAGLPSDQWKAPVFSVSMTTRLGLATVLGAIAVVILAHSKDQAPITNRCKSENCTITTIDEVMRKKVPKSTQEINRSADVSPVDKKPSQRLIKQPPQRLVTKPLLNKKDKSVQAMVVNGKAVKPVSKKPSKRLTKKPPWLVENPPQRLVENPPGLLEESLKNRHFSKYRRADDPFLWRESFN